eukprot:5714979-Amphidinium_carterae.1
MPSKVTQITSRYECKLKRKLVAVPFVKVQTVPISFLGPINGSYGFGIKWPRAPARCPEGRPCAKTLCMAQDRHKTWKYRW